MKNPSRYFRSMPWIAAGSLLALCLGILLMGRLDLSAVRAVENAHIYQESRQHAWLGPCEKGVAKLGLAWELPERIPQPIRDTGTALALRPYSVTVRKHSKLDENALRALRSPFFGGVQFLSFAGVDDAFPFLAEVGRKPNCTHMTINQAAPIGNEAFSTIAEGFPRLESLSLYTGAIDWHSAHLLQRVPIENLAIRRAHTISASEAEMIVRGFPLLTFLGVAVEEENALAELAALKHLETLRLLGQKPSRETGQYFHQYPNLTELQYDYYGGSRREMGVIRNLFKGPPSPSIHRIKLTRAHIDRGDLTRLREMCPKLQSLELLVCRFDGESLRALESFEELEALRITGSQLLRPPIEPIRVPVAELHVPAKEALELKLSREPGIEGL